MLKFQTLLNFYDYKWKSENWAYESKIATILRFLGAWGIGVSGHSSLVGVAGVGVVGDRDGLSGINAGSSGLSRGPH